MESGDKAKLHRKVQGTMTSYTTEAITLEELKRRVLTLLREGWTQHTFARDAEGRPCLSREGNAVCVCLSGALNRAKGSDTIDNLFRLRVSRLTKVDIVSFNDATGRTVDEMIRIVEQV